MSCCKCLGTEQDAGEAGVTAASQRRRSLIE